MVPQPSPGVNPECRAGVTPEYHWAWPQKTKNKKNKKNKTLSLCQKCISCFRIQDKMIQVKTFYKKKHNESFQLNVTFKIDLKYSEQKSKQKCLWVFQT